MQAILTKYIGPSNVRGSRVKATASAGSITIDYDDSLNTEDAHKAAAIALCDKMGWTEAKGYGRLISGGTDTGFVFVTEDRSVTALRNALGNLVQFVAGNRGDREGNPYLKKEVIDALHALHYHKTGQHAYDVPFEAAEEFKLPAKD